MQRIQVLPPSVAERIAAGEVVERPSSVVKELVENALDAGATEVAVNLEDGGKGLIEIIDNGHGMGREDLRLCLQRHATSKLRTLEDLEKIRTLGFRGEALPSIAAVSDFSIISRSSDATEPSTAHEIRADQATGAANLEPVTFGHFLGSQHGTCVRARALFAQVPARLKFLKAAAAEVAQVREWIERLAVTHPKVGFRLTSGDRVVLNLRPQDEATRVKAVLADGDDFPVVSASNEEFAGDGIRVRAHWIHGLSVPQTRKLVQVVNGRAVRDRLVQQAALAPFRQALLPGQFPALALFIDIDPAHLDVNVHPTKTEVRFLQSGKMFARVESLVASLIAREGAAAFAGGRGEAGTQSGAGFAFPEIRGSGGAGYSSGASFSGGAGYRGSSSWRAAEPAQGGWNFSAPPVLNTSNANPSDAGQPGEALAASSAPAHPLSTARFAGTAFNTYLMYELGEEFALVDQHAAHERIRYEKLRLRAVDPAKAAAPQALSIPEAVKFAIESRILFESRIPWLAKLGFEAEVFGDDTALFRAVPAEWGTDSLRARLKNLVERVIELDEPKGDLLLDEALFESLASEACHSSVRAGDRLEPAEAEALVADLFACEHPWNCPHGRPTVARVPKARFEEWFQRRV